MSTTEINLLGDKKKQRRNLNTFLVSLYGIFFVVFLLALALIAYSYTLNTQLEFLNGEASTIESQIAEFGERKDNLIILNERLNSIQTVIGARKALDIKIDSILSIIPQSLQLNTFTANNNSVSLTLNSPSLFAFDNLLEARLPSYVHDNDIGVKAVEVESFTREGGTYNLDLAFYFTTEAEVR